MGARTSRLLLLIVCFSNVRTTRCRLYLVFYSRKDLLPESLPLVSAAWPGLLGQKENTNELIFNVTDISSTLCLHAFFFFFMKKFYYEEKLSRNCVLCGDRCTWPLSKAEASNQCTSESARRHIFLIQKRTCNRLVFQVLVYFQLFSESYTCTCTPESNIRARLSSFIFAVD